MPSGTSEAQGGRGPRTWAGPSPFLVAVAVALIAGWLELSVTIITPRLAGRLTFNDWHALWITPTSYLLLLLPAWAGVAVIGRLRPSLMPPRVGVFLLVLPAAFGVLWLGYPRLHRFAIVVLALGIAVQCARLVAGRAGVTRILRATAGTLAGVSTLSALAVFGWPAVHEWRAHRALPAAAHGRPNVLLLILDTVRARSLSAYGHARPTTPALQRLASNGVLFQQAYATSSWTFPSHASLFTGRYPFELSADWKQRLGPSDPVLAEAFRSAGYRTGGFSANLYYTSQETGLARGFDHYEAWPVSFARVVEGSALGSFILNNPRFRDAIGFYEPYARRNGAGVTRAFLRWLDASDTTERPFLGFLNIMDAHEPYIAPEPYGRMFAPRPGRERELDFFRRGVVQRPIDERLPPEEIDSELRAYEGSIAYVDAVVGALFDSLEARGRLESTLVVVTSDHGELFGEYGLMRHGNALYPASLQVPLVISYPRAVPRGLVVTEVVSLRDVAATLVGLAGLASGSLPGTSLARFWDPTAGATAEASPLLSELWSAPNQPSWFPVVHGYMRAMVEWPHMLIRRGDGHEELLVLERLTDSLVASGPSERIPAALRSRLLAIPPTPFPGRGLVLRQAPASAPSGRQ